ncbi:MAG: hypothetical protein ABJF23_09865 [Bryobacteraceae bacterium]
MIGRITLFGLLAAGAAVSHEGHAGKPVTITGTVVDTGCYVTHDSVGSKHVDCATACARNGIPLAILDAKGKLFLPIAADHKNPNTQLMPFIEKKVKVTGTAMEKGGLEGIAIKTVQPAE